MDAISTNEPEETTTMGTQDVQPSHGASLPSADLDRRSERLDTAAGSEFVDDRIRLDE